METVTTVPLEMEFLRATSLHLFLLHLQGGNEPWKNLVLQESWISFPE